MKSAYPIVFTPIEDGNIMAQAYDIPTCITSGVDLTDALIMAQDALNGCLTCIEDDPLLTDIPAPTNVGDVPVPEGGFVSLVVADTVEYRKQTDSRSVHKTVSMPAWMATKADSLHVNLSQLLQGSLRELFGTG